MVVSNIFYVHPYLGKISNLTQMGWNHQPDQYVFKHLAGMLSLIGEISHTVRPRPCFTRMVAIHEFLQLKNAAPLVVDRLVANAQAVEIHSWIHRDFVWDIPCPRDSYTPVTSRAPKNWWLEDDVFLLWQDAPVRTLRFREHTTLHH